MKDRDKSLEAILETVEYSEADTMAESLGLGGIPPGQNKILFHMRTGRYIQLHCLNMSYKSRKPKELNVHLDYDWSPDGTAIVHNADGTTVTDLKDTRRLKIAPPGAPGTVRWLSDGTILFSYYELGEISVAVFHEIMLRTNKERWSAVYYCGTIPSFVCSDDGRLRYLSGTAIAGDYLPCIEKDKKRIPCKKSVIGVARDGSFLVANDDGVAELISPNGSPIRKLDSCTDYHIVNKLDADCVVVSPDDRKLFVRAYRKSESSGCDNTNHVLLAIDLLSGAILDEIRLEGKNDKLESYGGEHYGWAPDSNRLAYSTINEESGTLRLRSRDITKAQSECLYETCKPDSHILHPKWQPK